MTQHIYHHNAPPSHEDWVKLLKTPLPELVAEFEELRKWYWNASLCELVKSSVSCPKMNRMNHVRDAIIQRTGGWFYFDQRSGEFPLDKDRPYKKEEQTNVEKA